MTSEQADPRYDARRAELLSCLLDGEGSSARALVKRDADPAIGNDCCRVFRGYCVARSVLRGEFGVDSAAASTASGSLDIAARVRAELDADEGEQHASWLGGGARRGAWSTGLLRSGARWRGRAGAPRWSKRRTGTMVACVAAACAVTVGLVGERGSDVRVPGVSNITASGQPPVATLAASPATPSMRNITTLTPLPGRVPRIETASGTGFGQFDYRFATGGSMPATGVTMRPTTLQFDAANPMGITLTSGTTRSQ